MRDALLNPLPAAGILALSLSLATGCMPSDSLSRLPNPVVRGTPEHFVIDYDGEAKASPCLATGHIAATVNGQPADYSPGESKPGGCGSDHTISLPQPCDSATNCVPPSFDLKSLPASDSVDVELSDDKSHWKITLDTSGTVAIVPAPDGGAPPAALTQDAPTLWVKCSPGTGVATGVHLFDEARGVDIAANTQMFDGGLGNVTVDFTMVYEDQPTAMDVICTVVDQATTCSGPAKCELTTELRGPQQVVSYR